MPEDLRDGADHDLTLSERLGKATMNMLDHILEDYPECELESCAVVVAVRAPQGWVEPDERNNPNAEHVKSEYGQSFVSYYCEDPRRWVQKGLLAEALKNAENSE